MMLRPNLMIVVSCFLALLFLFGSLGSICSDAAIGVAAANDSNQAVNNPDKFGWELFAAINRSAGNGTNDAIWETWALQDNVYADPNTAPIWPGTAHQPKRLSRPIKLEAFRQQKMLRRSNQLRILQQRNESEINKLNALIIPENPLSEEVRMNKANFDFIVQNNLWYVEGQIAAFNGGRLISFPIDAKEVKAHWKVISATDKARYHWQEGADGKVYGLVALHIMTKDLPNWFWATWEHLDTPNRCKTNGCKDFFGIDPVTGKVTSALLDLFANAGMGAEWQNYRLTGTQTDFTDSTGRPTILGNSEIETFFMQTSSCITCHAKASVNGVGDRLEFFTPDGQSDNGVPDPTWFYNATTSGTTRKFLQLDFVWSLGLAQPRSQ
jgi:hypothetical protein